MLVATFNETTAWAGKTITHEGDAFMLQDLGPIPAAGVMEYDRQGHLDWAMERMPARVRSLAARDAAGPSVVVGSGSAGNGDKPASLAPSSPPLHGETTPRQPLIAALLLMAVVALAFSVACGQQAGTSSGAPAPVVSRTPSATPSVEASTWPQALQGTWVNSEAEPTRIVITETGGRAAIETTDAKGRVSTLAFTPSEMKMSFPGTPTSHFELSRPGSTAFTGTYRAELPHGRLTFRVAFGEDILVLSGTAIYGSGALIGKINEYFSSKDGVTLTHYDAGLPVKTAVYVRE